MQNAYEVLRSMTDDEQQTLAAVRRTYTPDVWKSICRKAWQLIDDELAADRLTADEWTALNRMIESTK